MIVEKIDIQKELVNVKDGERYLEYSKYDDKQFNNIPIGLPMKLKIKTVIYTIFEYTTGKKNISKFFAFKEEDNSWFKEMVETNIKIREEIHYCGVMDGMAKVKKLSWWKRLFNKF